jgi:hypothetical protein
MVTPTVTRFCRHLSLSLALVLLVMLGPGNVRFSTAAPAVVTGPVLSSVVAGSDLPNVVTVSGHGFTPGGRVYVALYDQWGVALYETRWVTASDRYFQPPLNLATGGDLVFDTGGTIAEAFVVEPAVLEFAGGSQQHAPVACTTAVMARAYDQSTASWSAMVDLACMA